MSKFNGTLCLKYYSVEELQDILNKFDAVECSGRGKKTYVDLPLAYDSEATNFDIYALRYLWQIGIMDTYTKFVYCVVGRTDKEFIQALDIISSWVKTINKKAKVCIYVHNYSYEFFFDNGIISFDDYFAIKQNKIAYAHYKNIEFRCSYLLSGVKLDKLSEFIPAGLKLNKLPKYNYNIIRTPITPLTDKEMAYGLQDVRILCHYVYYQLQTYGSIAKIPMTKHSRVRKLMQEYCMPSGKDTLSVIERNAFIREISQLQFHSIAEFGLATDAMHGGHNGYNKYELCKTNKDIELFDASSQYPSVICSSNMFPKSYIGYDRNVDEDYLQNEINEKHTFICELEFINLRPRTYHRRNKLTGEIEHKDANWDYFITDKMIFRDSENVVYDGGKVIQGSKVVLRCTAPDYLTFNMFYEWDTLKVNHICTYTTGYLPRKVIEFVLDLYHKKTESIDSLHRALAKEDINGISGMAVTSPLKDVVHYDEVKGEWSKMCNNEWLDTTYDFNTIEGNVKYYEDKIKNYNRKLFHGGVVIPYIAGIFIHAISRNRLAEIILAAGLQDKFLYSDTDSIYGKKGLQPIINDYNRKIIEQLYDMCDFYKIDRSKVSAEDIEGRIHTIGLFEKEGTYKAFKYINLKTYIKVTEDNELITTTAGLGKEEGCKFLSKVDENSYKDDDSKGKVHYYIKDIEKVFKVFDEGMKVPENETGQLKKTIFRGNVSGTITDYLGNDYDYNIKGSVNLKPVSFKIGEEIEEEVHQVLSKYGDVDNELEGL